MNPAVLSASVGTLFPPGACAAELRAPGDPALLLPEEAVAIRQITRKEKVYNVPCEDCERGPTHLVEFKEGDRTEQHYLCEGCEKDARKQ